MPRVPPVLSQQCSEAGKPLRQTPHPKGLSTTCCQCARKLLWGPLPVPMRPCHRARAGCPSPPPAPSWEACVPLPSMGTLSSHPKDSGERLAGGRGSRQCCYSCGLTCHPGDPATPTPWALPYIVSSEVAPDLGGVHRPPPGQHGARVEDLDAFQLRACLGVCKRPAPGMSTCGVRGPAQNPPPEGRWIWVLYGACARCRALLADRLPVAREKGS